MDYIRGEILTVERNPLLPKIDTRYRFWVPAIQGETFWDGFVLTVAEPFVKMQTPEGAIVTLNMNFIEGYQKLDNEWKLVIGGL